MDHHVDFLGMLLSTAMVFFLVYGLLNKENNINASWLDSNISGWLMIEIAMLVIFIVWEPYDTSDDESQAVICRIVYCGFYDFNGDFCILYLFNYFNARLYWD